LVDRVQLLGPVDADDRDRPPLLNADDAHGMASDGIDTSHIKAVGKTGGIVPRTSKTRDVTGLYNLKLIFRRTVLISAIERQQDLRVWRQNASSWSKTRRESAISWRSPCAARGTRSMSRRPPAGPGPVSTHILMRW